MRISCEDGNIADFEPPPDLNPAEVGEENEKEKRLKLRIATLRKIENDFLKATFKRSNSRPRLT